MNILITGGAGFVGTNLIKLILEKTNYRVISLDDYSSGSKKNHLKEFTGGEAAESFVGGAGDFIDTKFAGPYHPDFGHIKKLLSRQVDFDIMKRHWTDEVTPEADIDWEEIDWKYEYDKYLKKDNSKFINTSDTEMQYVYIGIKYDKTDDRAAKNKKFVNKTDEWKSIYENDTKKQVGEK